MPRTRASSLVRYKVFGGGSQVHEVASLEEFLASARSHKWVILLSLQKLPPGPKAWCPFLQPTLLEKGEIGKELKNRNCLQNLVVADASEPLFQPQIKEIVAAELAFVNMQNLLRQEDASSSRKKIKSKKASTAGGKGQLGALGDVQRVEEGIQQEGKEKGEDEEMQVKQQNNVFMAEQTTTGKEKGGHENDVNPWIEIDGGVTPRNAYKVIEAGANALVGGSAVFGVKSYSEGIKGIKTSKRLGAVVACSSNI